MTRKTDKRPHDIPLFSGGTATGRLRRAGRRDGDWIAARWHVALWIGVLWLPLVVLALIEGNAYGKGVGLPILHDFRIHVRFLLVLPVFLLAERLIEPRLNRVVRHFVDSGLVGKAERPAYDRIVERSRRLARSWLPELIALALVVALLALGIKKQPSLDLATWRATPADGIATLTLAGRWLDYVSMPLYQILILSCLLRFGFWCQFLWRISRLDLELNPVHPDRAGGLAFLGIGQVNFAYFALGLALHAAGLIGNQIIYHDAALGSHLFYVLGLAVAMVAIFLSPLLVFVPSLARAKMEGYLENEAWISTYGQAFDRERAHRKSDDDSLLHGQDIETYAALGDLFENLARMRVVPFDLNVVLWFVAATLAPMVPLVLATYSASEIIKFVEDLLL